MFWHRMPEALLRWELYLFDAPGILMVVWSLLRTFRKAQIEVHPRGLSIVRAGLFGSRRYLWTDQELKDIRCRNTELSVNDAPQYELEIHLATGKRIRLLRGMSRAALEAIAGEIWKVLWAQRPRYPASS